MDHFYKNKPTGRQTAFIAAVLLALTLIFCLLAVFCGGISVLCASIAAALAVLELLFMLFAVIPLLKEYDNGVNMLRAVCPTEHDASPGAQKLPIMIDELYFSIQRQYGREISQKQTSLTALQSQINPHFLYNTLDCIRGQAIESGVDEIAAMVESLSTIFRYSISTSDTLVPLRDEVYNVRTYFTIQQYRFKDRFSLDIQCEDASAMDCYMPKLTLQPLVENCIFHGLELCRSQGLILIHITATQKRLIITVSDNGEGIEPKQLSLLQESLNRVTGYSDTVLRGKHGIAMQNLSRRIKILFGPEYGIAISSQLGYGTEVEIVLPLMTSLPDEFS